MNAESLTESAVAQRYRTLRDRLEQAGGAEVTVVAVTKAFGPWAIEAAAACGIDHIGENYAQECMHKLADASTAAAGLVVHFIGRLQRNKVRLLADSIDVWQSVDRGALVTEIARRAPGASVMIQVNISGETAKGGCDIAEVELLVSSAVEEGLQVVGLMGVGPLGPPEDSRNGFRQLRRMVDSLGLQHCSMGMSGDLEVAVSEGATIVRIGSGLFGERPPHGLSNQAGATQRNAIT